MKRNSIKAINLFILALSFFSFGVGADEDEAKAKVTPEKLVTCSGCHGGDGNLAITPDTPKLGGQAADYIAEALTQYKNGQRNHAIMGAMAAGLSKNEIRELADYFAKQPSLLYSKY